MSEQVPFHAIAASRLRRIVRQKLLVQLLRLRHQPELAARGTMVGLAWAFTPTFGIRMPLVLLTWLVARHLLRWDFSLILGLAWTWTTNIVVLGPLYFVFYCTGRMLRGAGQGSADFAEGMESIIAADGDWLARISGFLQMALSDWGYTLWLGALPWSLLMAGLGYLGAHRFLRHRAAKGRRP